MNALPMQAGEHTKIEHDDIETRRCMSALRRHLQAARDAMLAADEHDLRSRIPENRATMLKLLNRQKQTSDVLLRHILAFSDKIIAALPDELSDTEA